MLPNLLNRQKFWFVIAAFGLILFAVLTDGKGESGETLSVTPTVTEGFETTSVPTAPITETEVVGEKVPTDEPLYPVVKVIDGDTIVVRIDGKDETVRLVGIDTPETVDPRKPVECFGKEASSRAKELLGGKKVRLGVDATQGERGKYGRLLRYVFLEDGTFLNLLMIREGYAHEYTYQTPYQYQTKFKQAQQEARENGRGLWAKDACGDKISGAARSAQSVVTLPKSAGSVCDCSGNLYNCSDFASHAKAQGCHDSCGGARNDIHHLDSDADGKACESLR